MVILSCYVTVVSETSLQSRLNVMSCLSRAGTSLTFKQLRSEVSINTDLRRVKNTSHEKRKDYFGDYNKSYLETFNEKLPYM